MSTAALELLLQLRDEASAGLGAIGDNLLKLAQSPVAWAAAATGALAGIGGAAVGFASDAAQGMNDFQASLGATKQEAEALSCRLRSSSQHL